MFGVSVLISDLWTSDLWLGVIFVGSTNVMSTEHTSRFIAPFLRWLNPDISIEVIAQIQFVVRKAAYVGEYAILAILFWRALHGGANLRMKMSILFIADDFGARHDDRYVRSNCWLDDLLGRHARDASLAVQSMIKI
jgi:hypothetical protein